MNISFDLDGVIADGHRFFFEILNWMRLDSKEHAINAELEYYNSRPLKYHPNLLMAEDDTGVIITARKPWAKSITHSWLKRYGIILPVYFVDPHDEIDWTNHTEGAKKAALMKSSLINHLGIDVHFDNNPVLVNTLRVLSPNTKVILAGGELM